MTADPTRHAWHAEAARGDELADRLLRIRDLHQESPAVAGYCSECTETWPCPTSLIAAGAR